MASLIETKVLSFGANGDGLVLIENKPPTFRRPFQATRSSYVMTTPAMSS
ncbi:hypothetical protein [Asaia platycodi]|nr:hypothetical protein [Asaia platycodi]